MHRGFYILEKHGQDAFDKFALKSRMPMQDVERIWNKYRYKNDPEFKADIDAKVRDLKIKIAQIGKI
jgi:hypothetical protein